LQIGGSHLRTNLSKSLSSSQETLSVIDERVKDLKLAKELQLSCSIVSLPVNCPLNDDNLAGFGKGGAIE